MRSSRPTLHRRLNVSLLMAGVVTLALTGGVYAFLDLQRFVEDTRQDAGAVALKLAKEWSNGTPPGQTPLPAPLPESVQWLGADDSPLATQEPKRQEDTWLSTALEGMVSLTKEVPVELEGKGRGKVVVDLGTQELAARIVDHVFVLGSLFAVSGAIALLLGRRLHRDVSGQLLDLAHAANAISARRDYSIRALRRSDDEVGILVDTFNHMITQIELQDIQLKSEVERAESAKRAKSQFLATMSHEIRTPINGILGMTQLMLGSDLNDEQRDFANMTLRSADGLLSIINDILDFSKGEAERYDLETVSFSLTELVEECLDTVAVVACEKKLELCHQMDSDLPQAVQGDPSRLRQVLLNLLSNALKFTHQGEITVRVGQEKLAEGRARLRFEVIDTGIGIPEGRMDKLFESFSQLDASRTRKYGGTGLGLAISKQIIEVMGGTVFVRTREGAGSTFGFKVELPVESDVSPTFDPVPTEKRILVADVNATSRGSVAQMLRETNTVELVGGGPTVRRMLQEADARGEPFDLLIADVRLLDDLTAPATGSAPPPPVPLVLLSPINQLASASNVDWLGRTACVGKPVKAKDLYWCIHELLRSDGTAPALPASPPPRSSVTEENPLAGHCILVAEDNPVNQKITTRFLEKLGATWELAQNGEEAVEMVGLNSYDAVLMDVQMPVMDGLEATLAIREREGLWGDVHLPIIALTASVLEEDRKHATSAGFDDYLSKPVKLEAMAAMLAKWCKAGAELAASPYRGMQR